MIEDHSVRHEALAIACPRCDQPAGQPCRKRYIVSEDYQQKRRVGQDGPRMARPHIARTIALIEARKAATDA